MRRRRRNAEWRIIRGSPGVEMVTPPKDYSDIGDLDATNQVSGSTRERRRAFALLWSATKQELDARGWSYHPGSICQLYITDGRAARLSWAWVSPAKQKLRIRLSFREPAAQRAALDAVRNVGVLWASTINVLEHHVRRRDGKELVLEARMSLRELLADCASADEMAQRLAHTVIAFVDAAA